MTPWITAHSGCENTPQDSMDSVEYAIRSGADAVEMDIRRAPDGTLYISHDRREGEEIGRKITLEAVFRRIAGTELKINCDIKEPFAIPGVLTLAKQYSLGKDRLILTGAVSPELLAMEPSVTENASVYLNVEEALKFIGMGRLWEGSGEVSFPDYANAPKPYVMDLLEEESAVMSMIRLMKALGVAGINLNHRLLTKELAELFRREGIPFSLWTPADVESITRCLKLEPANITTVTVELALKLRRELH